MPITRVRESIIGRNMCTGIRSKGRHCCPFPDKVVLGLGIPDSIAMCSCCRVSVKLVNLTLP